MDLETALAAIRPPFTVRGVPITESTIRSAIPVSDITPKALYDLAESFAQVRGSTVAPYVGGRKIAAEVFRREMIKAIDFTGCATAKVANYAKNIVNVRSDSPSREGSTLAYRSRLRSDIDLFELGIRRRCAELLAGATEEFMLGTEAGYDIARATATALKMIAMAVTVYVENFAYTSETATRIARTIDFDILQRK